MNMPRLALLDDYSDETARVCLGVRVASITAEQGVIDLAELIARIVDGLRRNEI